MPTGKSYTDPFSTGKQSKRGTRKSKDRDVASSPVSVFDERLNAVGKVERKPSPMSIDWSVPNERDSVSHDTILQDLEGEMEARWNLQNKMQHDDSPRTKEQGSVNSQGSRQDPIRCSTPVVRIQYDGEMISVSEQTADKLKEGECAWV